MKSERRHELQQNQLAGWLEKFIEEIKPHANLILGVTAVVIIGAFAWAYISGSKLAEKQQGWSEFHAAVASQDPEQLLLVAKQNSGTLPGYWALQTAGDLAASAGSDVVFTDKEMAEEKLTEARSYYKEVKSAGVDDVLLAQRALLGYAKAEESLYGLTGDGESIDAARNAYEKIVETWPDSSVAKAAESRLDFLAMADGKQFYSWLAEYKPTPPPIGNPPGGPFNQPMGDPGLQLPSELELPDIDFGLEGLDDAADTSLDPPGNEESPAPPPADGN